MKRMLFLGALVFGVTVCSQSFGFELLDRMLGHKGCTSCCEPGCDAGNGCCEPGCGAGNGCAEPACGAGNGCAEPACGAGNGCAEPACGAGNGCAEPACGAGNGCAEPACDAGAGCCEPSCGAAKHCGKKKHRIADLLKAIHQAKKSRCHKSSCCEPDCSAGCCEPGCGAEPACGAAACSACESSSVAPAPTPDASAKKQTSGKVVAVSRTVSAK